MALSRVTIWNSGDILTAAALNGEFNNVLNNAITLISPYTSTVDAGNKQTINFILEKLAAAVTPANQARLYYRTDNNLPEFDTGSNTRTIPDFVWSGGQLTKSGANLQFATYAHNLIPINGRLEIIPDTPPTLGTGGLAASTTYNIYAFMSGATLTMEASATAKAQQAGTGVPIKSGDATRTFLGTATTDAGILWSTIVPVSSFWSPTSPTFIYMDELTGLGTSNDGGSPNTVLDIAVGSCASDDATVANRVQMSLTSAFTKSTSAWAVGTGNGGLDTGAVANSTWYHVYIIQRTDTNNVDVLFSTSASSPTMPTNYNKRRRIGSFFTSGAAAIIAFTQVSDLFLWSSPVLDINDTNPGAAVLTKTLTTPLGVQVEALFNAVFNAGSSTNAVLYFKNPAVTDQAPAANAAPLGQIVGSGAAGANSFQAGQVRILTNTSSQVNYRLSASGVNDIVRAATVGWYDRRGRG